MRESPPLQRINCSGYPEHCYKLKKINSGTVFMWLKKKMERRNCHSHHVSYFFYFQEVVGREI